MQWSKFSKLGIVGATTFLLIAAMAFDAEACGRRKRCGRRHNSCSTAPSQCQPTYNSCGACNVQSETPMYDEQGVPANDPPAPTPDNSTNPAGTPSPSDAVAPPAPDAPPAPATPAPSGT